MKMQLKTGGKEEDKRKYKWQIDKGNKFTNNKNVIKIVMRNQEMLGGGWFVFHNRCSNEKSKIIHSEEGFEGQWAKSYG